MRYGSVCSGIEAASVAWHSLGWKAQWYSEIEHFPSAVLKYRFHDVPNLGDMTQLNQNPVFNEQPIDLLVGGTPCQSFSVAGLRGGLADPRGNLMLTFLGLADAKKPKWIVWENVPGVLSSNGGKDFGTFLGALGELGYGFAYRVLDAQHFGVAQRRRRVFVVGYLGDWRPAAAVLFESESLQRDSKPSRKKRQETTTDAEGSVGEAGKSWWDGGQTAATLTKQNAGGNQRMPDKDNFGAVLEQKDVSCAGGNISPCVTSKWKTGYGGPSGSNETGNMVYEQIAQPKAAAFIVAKGSTSRSIGYREENAPTLVADQGNNSAVLCPSPVAQLQYFENHAQDSRVTGPHDIGNAVSAKYGTGGGNTPIVSQPIAVDTYNQTINEKTTQTIGSSASDVNHYGAVLEQKSVGALCARDYKGVGSQYVDEGKVITSLVAKGPHAVANPKVFDWQSGGDARGLDLKDIAQLQRCQTPALLHTMAIRRLTPKECERLQGFPDDWTKIPYRNKPADQCPDGPRYKACGNSMAVPVMRWIGERIQMIENYLNP